MRLTFLYDAVAFFFWRTGDGAFALIADATAVMNVKELRDAGEYLLALAENRAASPQKN